jgi:hypothetical protein
MLNVAIGLAFLLSSLFTLGERIITLFISLPVFRSLPDGQQAFMFTVAGYWLPAALIYLAIRMAPSSRLKLTKAESLALGTGNVVLVLYVIARAIASTVEGGGAGYAVASLSIFTALPALVTVGIVMVKSIVRALRSTTNRSGVVRSTTPQRRPLSFAAITAILLVGFGPPMYVGKLLFVGANSPFHIARKAAKRMTELCDTAGEKILRVPSDVQGIFLDPDSSWGFGNIDRGIYTRSWGGTGGQAFLNKGLIRFFETLPYSHTTKESKSSHYDRHVLYQQTQQVNELLSEYGVFLTKLTDPDDDRLGTEGYELSIKELSTNEVLATSRIFHNKPTRKFCGHQVNGTADGGDFVRRALGLEKRFDSRTK